jgi:hypothetical protein
MNRLSAICLLGILITLSSVAAAKEQAITPDLARINDGKSWRMINADYASVTQAGQSVARLKAKGKPTTGSNVGLALVEGLEFTEGTLEVDLKGQGKTQRCFLGVAFNAVDGKTFEAVYFRPFNFLRDPESFRSHSVQYIAWPDNTWEKLRAGQPGKFEATVKPIPDPTGWFHARVEVTNKKVRVWVEDAKEPCLVVDRLADPKKAQVGLWVDSHDGEFRNLKIVPAH